MYGIFTPLSRVSKKLFLENWKFSPKTFSEPPIDKRLQIPSVLNKLFKADNNVIVIYLLALIAITAFTGMFAVAVNGVFIYTCTVTISAFSGVLAVFVYRIF